MRPAWPRYCHNIGFDCRDKLNKLCAGWDRLADEVRPDAVVMDFSPTALLAFQGHPARRVLIDNGYSHPTLTCPMPSLRPWQARYEDMQQRIEDRLLREVNACLADRGQAPLEFLAELFGRADDIHLMTVAELDHSGPKDHVHYRGYLTLGGNPPEWPARRGRARVLVVLKPFAGIDRLLAGLLARNLDILAVIPGLDDASRAALRQLPGLTLVAGWLDLRQAARQADGVLCAGGDSVGICAFARDTGLRACPTSPNKRLTGLRAEATGCGFAGASACISRADPGSGRARWSMMTVFEDRPADLPQPIATWIPSRNCRPLPSPSLEPT